MAANKKRPYNWNFVKPGDIISFRYKSKSTGKLRTHSVLVLNPKLNVTLKDYQKRGLSWLIDMENNGKNGIFGGLLCDEMGLGKTLGIDKKRAVISSSFFSRSKM